MTVEEQPAQPEAAAPLGVEDGDGAPVAALDHGAAGDVDEHGIGGHEGNSEEGAVTLLRLPTSCKVRPA